MHTELGTHDQRARKATLDRAMRFTSLTNLPRALAGKEPFVGEGLESKVALAAAERGCASILRDLFKLGYEPDQEELKLLLRELISPINKLGKWGRGEEASLTAIIDAVGLDRVSQHLTVFHMHPVNLEALAFIRRTFGDSFAIKDLVKAAKGTAPRRGVVRSVRTALDALAVSGMNDAAFRRLPEVDVSLLFEVAGWFGDEEAVKLLVTAGVECDWPSMRFIVGALRAAALGAAPPTAETGRAFRTLVGYDDQLEEDVEKVTLWLNEYQDVPLMDAILSIPFIQTLAVSTTDSEWAAECAVALLEHGYSRTCAAGVIPEVSGSYRDIAQRIVNETGETAWREVMNHYREQVSMSAAECVTTRNRRKTLGL